MNAAFPRPQLGPVGDAAGADNRRLPRDRTAKACTLVHGMFRERQDGVVRDIHERGARIRPAAPPETFQGRIELIVDGRTYHGEIAWRSRTEMGLRFDVVDPLARQAFARD